MRPADAWLASAVAREAQGRRVWLTPVGPDLLLATVSDARRWLLLRRPSWFDGPRAAFYSPRLAADLAALLPLVPAPDTDLPGSVFVHLTEHCDAACRHCYAPRGPVHLDTGVLLRLLDDWPGATPPRLTLSGGEPRRHPEFWRLLDEFSRRGVAVTVLTHGRGLDDEQAQALARAGATALVSLHGPPAIHDALAGAGSCALAEAGLAALARALPRERLGVNATLTDALLPHMEDMIERAAALGAGRMRFIPLHSRARLDDPGLRLTPEHPDFLAWVERAARAVVRREWPIPVQVGPSGLPGAAGENDDGLTCSIGRRLTVSADGGVYACPLLMQPAWRLGAARDPAAGWQNSPALAAMERRVRERPARDPHCRACALAGLCQGGCLALAVGPDGGVDHPNPHCAAVRAYARVYFAELADSCGQEGKGDETRRVHVPPG